MSLPVSVSLGPYAISVERLLLVVAFVLILLTGQLLGRRYKVDVESVLMQMIFGGLLVARLAFVIVYREEYLEQPLSILDIRDGGFLIEAGLLVALLVATWQVWRRKAIRRPLIVAVLVGSMSWVGAVGLLQFMRSVQPALPDLALLDLDQQPVMLSELGGRPVVVNLWATWCGPCRREMPVLERAQQEEDNIRFVFINQGESASVVMGYLAASELELDNVLLDHRSATSQAFASRGLPATFFFDENGLVVDSHLGELSAAVLKQKTRRLSRSN